MKPKNLGFSPNENQLIIGFLDLFKGSLGQNSEEAGAMAGGWTYRAWLPLWFSSMTVSFNNLSSLIIIILFLCYLSITMSKLNL